MKLRKLFSKAMMGCVNAVAMMLVVQTANSACIWLIHQPEFPVEAKAYARKK